jgi:hypothetical protein
MSNEQTYASHLLTYDEAMERLHGAERRVLKYAWDVYHHTVEVEKERRRAHERLEEKERDRARERLEEIRKQESSSSRPRSSKVNVVFESCYILFTRARPQPAIHEERAPPVNRRYTSDYIRTVDINKSHLHSLHVNTLNIIFVHHDVYLIRA